MDSLSTGTIKEQIAAIEEEYNREDEEMRQEMQKRLDNKRVELDLELKLFRETLERELLEEQERQPGAEAKQIIEAVEAKRRKEAETRLSAEREEGKSKETSH